MSLEKRPSGIPELPPPTSAVEIDPCGTPKNGGDGTGLYRWVGFAKDERRHRFWGVPTNDGKSKLTQD